MLCKEREDPGDVVEEMELFDEAVTNALDAAHRDATVRQVTVTWDGSRLVVQNDGLGIPVTPFKDTGRIFVQRGVFCAVFFSERCFYTWVLLD